jgi:hypothetical protein
VGNATGGFRLRPAGYAETSPPPAHKVNRGRLERRPGARQRRVKFALISGLERRRGGGYNAPRRRFRASGAPIV